VNFTTLAIVLLVARFLCSRPYLHSKQQNAAPSFGPYVCFCWSRLETSSVTKRFVQRMAEIEGAWYIDIADSIIFRIKIRKKVASAIARMAQF
jgi:hypothetical protein